MVVRASARFMASATAGPRLDQTWHCGSSSVPVSEMRVASEFDVAQRLFEFFVDVEAGQFVADGGRDLDLLLDELDVAGEFVAFERDADVERRGGRSERKPQLVGAAEAELRQHDAAAIDEQLVAGDGAGAIDRGLHLQRQRAARVEPQSHRLVVAGRSVGDVGERAEELDRLAGEAAWCLRVAACGSADSGVRPAAGEEDVVAAAMAVPTGLLPSAGTMRRTQRSQPNEIGERAAESALAAGRPRGRWGRSARTGARRGAVFRRARGRRRSRGDRLRRRWAGFRCRG